jgi:hypothetical protein
MLRSVRAVGAWSRELGALGEGGLGLSKVSKKKNTYIDIHVIYIYLYLFIYLFLIIFIFMLFSLREGPITKMCIYIYSI